MVITYQGEESFKISQGNLTIAVNPSTRAGADITLISSRAFEADGKGFVIDGPGEYEVKDISIKGFPSESMLGGKKRINTIYMVGLDSINLCFLGALSNPELSSDTTEDLEDIDILFVPVGEGTLDAAAANKLAVSLEPAIIIPMHYTQESLKKFLKESGADESQTLEKLVVKKKDLDGKEGEIIILNKE